MLFVADRKRCFLIGSGFMGLDSQRRDDFEKISFGISLGII
jgi:hypothetical protein